jgi:hypothetical protein
MHSLRNETSDAVNGREKKSKKQNWLGESDDGCRHEIRQRSDETDTTEYPGDERRCDRACHERRDQLASKLTAPVAGEPRSEMQSPQLSGRNQ